MIEISSNPATIVTVAKRRPASDVVLLRPANGDLTSSVPRLHCAQECVARQRGLSRREDRGQSAEREGGSNAAKAGE